MSRPDALEQELYETVADKQAWTDVGFVGPADVD